MYHYYENKACITGQQFQELFSLEVYRNGVRRGYFTKHGTRGNGREVYIEVETIKRQDIKKKIIASLGPLEEVKKTPFLNAQEPDVDAMEYYSSFILDDGSRLTDKVNKPHLQYTNEAAIFNMMKRVWDSMVKSRQAKGERIRIKDFIQDAYNTAHSTEVQYDFPHNLPKNIRHFENKYKKYITEGYYSLISKKYCNDNSRKVSVLVERMLLSLYIMPNKPFATGEHQSVHQMYCQFLASELEVFDKKTGECFNPADFKLSGKSIEISESTVWNYINNPENRKLVDQFRMGRFDYNNLHRPFNQRKRGLYAFSKISMDDRTLPRKSTEGWVNSYIAVDVVSECWVGVSYMLGKPDTNLVWECLRDMYRMIDRNNIGMPLQVEVERHLTGELEAELQAMFPYVRVCIAGNSREKRAEHAINQKKYGVEKAAQAGIGRWYAKSEAKRTIREKNRGELTDGRLLKKEDIIADDKAAVIAHNNELHSRQKTYPNMTRWQVLQSQLNPNLKPLQKHIIYKYIGHKTKTSLQNNDYCQVQYENYTIDNQEVIKRLKPNDYGVQAYYLPSEDGEINDVYLYQDDVFLSQASKVVRYNENIAERTEEDERIRIDQSIRQKRFDKQTKEATKEKIFKPGISKTHTQEILKKTVTVKTSDFPPLKNNIDDLLKNYNPEYEKEKALAAI